METETSGHRAVPPALLVGLALPIVWGLARIALFQSSDVARSYQKIVLVGEGVGFATAFLVLAGTLELARRMTGRARMGLNVAVAGVALSFASDVLTGLVQFTSTPWDHRLAWKVYDYAGACSWLVFAVGLLIALPAARRALGFVALAVTFITWPIEPLREPLFGWMHLGQKSSMYFESAMRLVRYGMFIAVAISVSRGTSTTTDPYAAGNGLRLAAKALWLRVIAAVCVVLFTLMTIASRGSGGLELFRFVMMAQGLVGVIALAMFGGGALRAARASVPGLSGYTLVVGGAGSLWAAGVSLAQLPYLYKMLYKNSEDSYSRSDSMEWAQALATAMPIVVIVGVALLATALSGYAARRGKEDLRTSAQGHGIGFVALMLVAVGIQTWMLPKSSSIGNYAMLALLAAGAGLWGTVLMAKLLARGADVVEEEPGLPPANIVNVGPGPGAP
jgi:hypothetical protein